MPLLAPVIATTLPSTLIADLHRRVLPKKIAKRGKMIYAS
jgi:hypothetical protein